MRTLEGESVKPFITCGWSQDTSTSKLERINCCFALILKRKEKEKSERKTAILQIAILRRNLELSVKMCD